MQKILENPLSSELKPLYTPIKKIGKWTILVENSRKITVCACDGFFTYWGIIYPYDYSVAYDHPERIPEGVKNWIRNVYAKRLGKSRLTIDK